MVTAVGAGVERPDGAEEIDAEGRWADPGPVGPAHAPGPVDAVVAAPRPRRRALARGRDPGWSPSGSRSTPTCPSSAGATAPAAGTARSRSPSSTRSRATPPVVLISGDGHHAWLNTTALLHLAMPVRDSVVRETEWFAAYPRLVTLVGNDGTSPEAYRRMLDDAAAPGHRRHGRLRVRGAASRSGPSGWAQGCDRAADPLGDVRRHRSTTSSPPACAPATRCPAATTAPRWGRSRSSATARSTPGPPGAASRTATRTGSSTPPASRTSPASSCASCSRRAHAAGLEIATHAIGDAAVREALAAYADTGARGSIEHAQMARRDDVRRMAAARHPRERAARRTCSTTATSPTGSGASAPSAASRSAGCSTTASSSRSAPTRRSRRSTRGWRWPPPCTAAPTSASPWHGEQALTVREALAASVDGQPTVGPGRAATWCSSTATRCCATSTPSDTAAARPRAAGHAGRADRPSPAAWSATPADPAPPAPDARVDQRRAGQHQVGDCPLLDRERVVGERRGGGRDPPVDPGSAAQMSWPALGAQTSTYSTLLSGGGRLDGLGQALVDPSGEGVVAVGQRQVCAGADSGTICG